MKKNLYSAYYEIKTNIALHLNLIFNKIITIIQLIVKCQLGRSVNLYNKVYKHINL